MHNLPTARLARTGSGNHWNIWYLICGIRDLLVLQAAINYFVTLHYCISMWSSINRAGRCGCRTSIRCYTLHNDGLFAPGRRCSFARSSVVSAHAVGLFSTGLCVLSRSKLAPVFLLPFIWKHDEHVTSAISRSTVGMDSCRARP